MRRAMADFAHVGGAVSPTRVAELGRCSGAFRAHAIREPLWYFSMMQPRSSRSGPRLDIETPATRRAEKRPRLGVVHARALYRPVPPVEFDDDGHPCRDGCTEGGRYPDRRVRGAAAVGRSMMFRAGSGRRNAVDALGCRGRLGGDCGHRANGCVLTTRPAIAR